MTDAAMVVESPSGESNLDNIQFRRMSERYLGGSELSGVGDLRDLHDRGAFELVRPDGRCYEFEEWPVMRTISSGEEVRDEELIQRMADGAQLWLRCNSSPIYDEEGRVVAAVQVVHDITEHKRAEEALRESNRRTENVLEIITDAFWAVDRDWRFTYVNDQTVQIFSELKGKEFTREELVGQSVWEVFPNIVGTLADKKYRQAAAEQQPVVFEYHYPGEGEEGEERPWFDIHLYPSEEGLSVYYQDITERKRAEAELLASKDELNDELSAMSRLHELSTRLFATSELSAVLEGVLDASIELQGADFGNIQLYNWETGKLDIVAHRGFDQEFLDYFRDMDDNAACGPALERGERVVIEDVEEDVGFEPHRQIAAAGGFRAVQSTPLFDRHGEALGTLSTHFRRPHRPSERELRMTDLYARQAAEMIGAKLAEERLRRSEGRLQRALEIGTVGVIFFSTDGSIVGANDAFLQMSGYSREDLAGGLLRWDEMTPAEWMPHSLNAVEELKSNGRTTPYEKEYLRKDGSRWWGLFAATHLGEDEGVEFIIDITERKRAEQEVEARTRQQAAAAELGQWALATDDLQTLLDEAVACVARTLGVEYVKVVEPLPDGEEMLLRAGVGWRAGLVGRATESAKPDSEAGYTIGHEGPVIVADVHAETRFEPSELIAEHGITSGMTVVIYGQEEPFGVLCAHSTSRRTFSDDDANFLQAVANVLASAIERQRAEERLEEVREAERSRIARDLHDEALQDLTDALVEAQLARATPPEDPKLPQRLEMLVAALDRIGPQLRGAIYDLRLQEEQDKSFSELLESLVRLQNSMNPDAEVRLNPVGDGVLEEPLGEKGRAILRVLREALTNVRRHSGARNVQVTVQTSEVENKLLAKVEDDGRGFDPAEEEPSATAGVGGVGTRGMVERVRLLGGDLKIESEPGRGTKVSLEVPLGEGREDQLRVEEALRILLVDDHTSIREALASTFQSQEGFAVVEQAGSLAEARRMLEEVEEVDVAVLDLGLPDGYGADLIREIRQANPRSQALVLSASLDRSEIARAVEAGAAGVLHKTAHLDEVVEAVERLRRGETLVPLGEVLELLRFAGSERRQEYEARRAIESLTPREVEVLRALAEGLDSEAISQKLHISIRTERNHIQSILKKLGVHSRLQALVFAMRHGVVELR